MPSKHREPDSAPRLYPQQVCFVVDDVALAVQYCEQHFGWGPFYQFKAPVADASYKDWRGEKLTEVALGMAGKVQVEFLHVLKGRDTTADYQQEFGTGLQHLGIHCSDRDAALSHLESLGASVNEINEYPGVRFAFVNIPTGPGMFEILQATKEMASNKDMADSTKSSDQEVLFGLDRATIVTHDIDQALAFYSATFGWQDAQASDATLRCDNTETKLRRYLGKAGALQLELIQGTDQGDDPYSAHLRRGNHGLVHASGVIDDALPSGAARHGEWLDSGENFALYSWAGGECALQIRRHR